MSATKALNRPYRDQLADAIVSKIAMPAGRGLEPLVINQFMKELSRRLSLHIVRTSIVFKHEGYRSEEEFRFLHPIIHTITIGPAANYEKGNEFVKHCAREAKLPIDDAQILRSAIPYRGP
jgi:hypothetical protein